MISVSGAKFRLFRASIRRFRPPGGKSRPQSHSSILFVHFPVEKIVPLLVAGKEKNRKYLTAPHLVEAKSVSHARAKVFCSERARVRNYWKVRRFRRNNGD